MLYSPALTSVPYGSWDTVTSDRLDLPYTDMIGPSRSQTYVVHRKSAAT